MDRWTCICVRPPGDQLTIFLIDLPCVCGHSCPFYAEKTYLPCEVRKKTRRRFLNKVYFRHASTCKGESDRKIYWTSESRGHFRSYPAMAVVSFVRKKEDTSPMSHYDDEAMLLSMRGVHVTRRLSFLLF